MDEIINQKHQVNVLTIVVFLMMIMNVGLFVKTKQLQTEVLTAIDNNQKPMVEGLEKGTKAPPAELYTADKKLTSVGDFLGQEVLLVFTATTCTYCKEIYPVLSSFEQQHPEFQVLMVSKGTENENFMLVQDERLKFPVLTWDDTVAQTYRVPGTPYFYYIDAGGIISNAGFLNTSDQLEGFIKAE